MNINIKKLGGEVEISSPSLATCFEFVSLWSAETDNAQLARLCAGSIGVCLDHMARLPKYRPVKHRASDYGHTCLDRLLGLGVTASVIYEEGVKCLSYMSQKIPTEREVDERANFSSTQEPDTSTD
jgi:hypothetical protein